MSKIVEARAGVVGRSAQANLTREIVEGSVALRSSPGNGHNR